MKRLLLYNLENEKGKQIEKICSSLHIGILHVKPEEYLEQIGSLAGYPGFTKKGTPLSQAVLTDEMILFCEFIPKEIYSMLDAFRKANIVSVDLKASLTQHNVHWNSLQLYQELLGEHKAFQEK